MSDHNWYQSNLNVKVIDYVITTMELNARNITYRETHLALMSEVLGPLTKCPDAKAVVLQQWAKIPSNLLWSMVESGSKHTPVCLGDDLWVITGKWHGGRVFIRNMTWFNRQLCRWILFENTTSMTPCDCNGQHTVDYVHRRDHYTYTHQCIWLYIFCQIWILELHNISCIRVVMSSQSCTIITPGLIRQSMPVLVALCKWLNNPDVERLVFRLWFDVLKCNIARMGSLTIISCINIIKVPASNTRANRMRHVRPTYAGYCSFRWRWEDWYDKAVGWYNNAVGTTVMCSLSDIFLHIWLYKWIFGIVWYWQRV
jgi:hypothetical protein